MAVLAIHGGPKAKPQPYHQPSRYGDDELMLLKKAVEEGKLMGPGGMVREFEAAVEEAFGAKHAVMVTSGTAALHTALAALGVSEGHEVITNPMTDIGTVAAILALHAIPIFADIDLGTRLIDPAAVRRKVNERTKAVIAVHMSGLPCDMDALMAISRETGIAVLEDCAQAHGGTYKGQVLGTIGHAAGFSMNESKQMTTGDGGFVLTNDDEVARIANLFRDKSYIREGPQAYGEQPIPFFALNYRPTCLQAAVGLAQLSKLDALVARRDEIARTYYRELGDLPDLEFPDVQQTSQPSWWPISTRYTGNEFSRDELVSALRAEGLSIRTTMCPAGNILRSRLIADKRYYPGTDTVPAFWRETSYDPESCPCVDELLRTVIRLPVDQRYTDEDIEQTVDGFRKVWNYFFQT